MKLSQMKQTLNKRMFKTTFKGLLLLCFLIACTFEYKPCSFTQNDEIIELQFGRKMNKNLLDSLQKVLKNSGIELKYTELKYDGDKLSRLAFQVEYNGNAGNAKTNFVNKGKSFGFRIEPKTNRMIVGELNPK